MIREYRTVEEIASPLMIVRMVDGVTYDELAEIQLSDGTLRRCKVLEVNGARAVVQLFDSSAGINLRDATIRFLGHPLQLAVSGDMLGRVFNGMGKPIDGGPEILNEDGAASFDPQLIAPNEELTIVVDGVQGRFRTTNWYITAAVTLLSGILAYFVSGRALKPLRSFTSQVEQVQLNNLADMRIDEDAISEFRQLSRSFNQMLERLNNAFSAQRQFTGNAAHELRTPLALMQAQLELFSAEHPDVRPETAEFLTLLREQTERLIQLTRTLLEMSNLRQVARNERIQLAPMIEEIFTDLAPLSDKLGVTLTAEGDGIMTGSDALIYRLIFNLTENAVKYNRPGGSVRVSVTQELEKLLLRVSDTGCGIPEVYQRSIFQPFFRVDKSRSREYGGAGLGLSLVWEIADLHGGSVWVEKSSEKGTTIAVGLPTQQSTEP